MNPDESDKAIKLLAGLFVGQITTEHAVLLRRQLAPFRRESVHRAIESHRLSHEFLSLPKLLEGCRAHEHSDVIARENAGREGNWADVYRRQNPSLATAGDFEVCLRVHRGWWHRCSRSDGYRRKFESSCRNALISLGMDAKAAETWIQPVFNDDVEYFRRCLDELRTEPPASSRA